MEVVAPSSVPILVMVARSGTDNPAMPGPPHSITCPTPPLTERSRRTSKLMSLAVTKGRSAPVSSTLMTLGMVM